MEKNRIPSVLLRLRLIGYARWLICALYAVYICVTPDPALIVIVLGGLFVFITLVLPFLLRLPLLITHLSRPLMYRDAHAAEILCRLGVAVARVITLQSSRPGGTAHSSLTISLTALSPTLTLQGKHKELMVVHKELVDIFTKQGAYYQAASSASHLANDYLELGEIKEADVISERSVTTLRRVYTNKEQPSSANTDLQKFSAADQQAVKAAIERLDKSQTALTAVEFCSALATRARVFELLYQFENALPLRLEATQVAHDASNRLHILELANLGELQAKLHNLEQARLCIEEAVALTEKNPDTPGLDRAHVRLCLGRLYLFEGAGEKEAAEFLQSAYEFARKHLGSKQSHGRSKFAIAMAVLRFRQGQEQEAERLLKETIELRTKCYGPNHPHLLAALEYYAELLQSKGDITSGAAAEVENLKTQAQSIRKKYDITAPMPLPLRHMS